MATPEDTPRYDITEEEFRTYTYGDGKQFKIDRPVWLYVIKDDGGVSHRVVDLYGLTHRPERNWAGISWKPKTGFPAFSF
jgi:hypothetical protein